jgi:outer membrane protein assembly factor BamE (lipoprotein component of BamABCDE complex)
MKFPRIPLLLVVVVLPACIFSRTKIEAPIDKEKLEQIVVGQSDKEDVVRILGAPVDIIFNNKMLDPLNVFAYEYVYNVQKSSTLTLIIVNFVNNDSKRDHVLVFFNENGIVTGVGSRFQAEDAEYSLPFGG